MGALTTAFELSEGDWTNRFERITVYQRGWRLGGKGASSRGPHGRIEEHGLHVLLGYYDHTFDVMRRCYEALDRERSDPSCPIRAWDDAVAPSNVVGVVDQHDGTWEPWVATFSRLTGRPGGDGARPTESPPSPWPTSWSGRSACWSTSSPRSRFAEPPQGGAIGVQHLAHPPDRSRHLSRGLDGRRRAGRRPARSHPSAQLGRTGRRAGPIRGRASVISPRALPPLIEPVRRSLRGALRSNAATRRSYELVELVTTNLVGIMADGLLTRPDGLRVHQSPRLPRVAARARHRPRGARVADPPGHVRPRLRLRGRRSRPARASVPGSGWSWPPRCSSGTRARSSGGCRRAWER